MGLTTFRAFAALGLLLALLAPVQAQVPPGAANSPASAVASAPPVAAVPAPAAAELAAPAAAPSRPGLVKQDSLNAADTGWMMTSTALVLLMTLPGIALFYGGMVRRKNVLNTMASVVAIAALVSLLWFALGYSWAFTPGNEWIGGNQRLWFGGLDYRKETGMVAVSHIATNIPESVYAMFQLTFAIITVSVRPTPS